MATVKSRPIDPAVMASKADMSTFEPVGIVSYAPRWTAFDPPEVGWNATWLWCTVGTASGKEYMVIRAYGSDVSANFAVLETAPDIWSPTVTRVAPVPDLATLYWGEIRWEEHADHVSICGHNPALPELRVEMAPDRFRLIESDLCDLVFHPVRAPRIRLLVPGPPEPVGYTNEMCSVTGTIEGDEVVWGYGAHERLHGPLGSSWYRGKIFTDLQQVFLGWGTPTIGNGPREFGLIFFGNGDYAAAYHVIEGEKPVTANELDYCDIEWQERDGLVRPLSMRYGFAGRDFEATSLGSLQVPGPDLDRHWLTAEVRQTNRAGAKTCRGLTEVLNSLEAE